MDRVLHSRLSLGKTPYSLSTKWGMGTSEVNAGAILRWTNRGTNWGVFKLYWGVFKLYCFA